MSHAVFSIVADVIPGHEDALERVLRRVEADHAGNGIIDFTRFTTLHFASFTLFRPEAEQKPLSGRNSLPGLLVFEHNVDGRWSEHLDALVAAAGPGLREIYQHCQDAPVGADDQALRQYLRDRVHTPNLYHVGTPYRRADTVRADLDLRMFLDRQADRLAQNGRHEFLGNIWNRLRATATPPPTGDYLSPNVNAQEGGVSPGVSRPEPRLL